ncbi:serine hydrolase FSH [Jackrogersella minutella]|nr:serine hydrolase FSH [Jackrogersella minutella]
MKILCLHEDGQNRNTFKSSLAPLLQKLNTLNTELLFDFANGPLEYSGIPAKDSLPDESTQYKFYETEEAKNIHKASEWLATKLDRDGPYDGVIASSQGAALVSSFLLYRQWYDHELPPAFKFAVFVSGSIVLKVLNDLGVPVSNEAEEVVAQAKLRHAQALGPSPVHTAKARRAVFNSDDCFGLNLNRVPLELKIRIPTVHVWGENDALFPTSVQLAGFCDPYIRKIYTHQGAHVVPQGEEEVDELASLIDWCIHRAAWPGQTQL